MPRSRPYFAAALLPLLFFAPVFAQTADSAPQQDPEALTARYNQAMLAKDWPQAVTTAQELVNLHATSQNLKLLGNAQLYSGFSAEALDTYNRALAAAEQEKPAEGQAVDKWKDGEAQIYIGRGNALLKLHRTPEAIENYNHAAELAINSARAYFNVCAVLYNTGDTKNAPAACRKCLQADPTMANAWFILGSVLFADAPINGQGKVVATTELREALEKYLALAPEGPHAADTKAMLDMVAK
jgi:tetratricopeptide (TPR) repeat protein